MGSTSILDLWWSVNLDGYEIVTKTIEDSKSKRSREVTMMQPINEFAEIKRYNVNDYPHIFMEFADIAYEYTNLLLIKNDLLINFANHYGVIDHHYKYGFIPLEYWRRYVRQLSEAVKIWTLIKNKNERNLSKLEVFFAEKNAKKELDDRFSITQWERFIERSNTALNALDEKEDDRINICQANINDAKQKIVTLKDGLSSSNRHKSATDEILEISRSEFNNKPALNLYESGYQYLVDLVNIQINSAVTPRVLLNKYNTGTEFKIAPNKLIDAIWISFALALSKNMDFRSCVEINCHNYFEITTATRRFEKQYCSDRCRKRAERRRKKK